MDGSRSSADLQSILDAISSSDVVESRIQLLKKLEDLDLSSKSDLISLVESLIIFWEDFTCLDVTQCLLNRTILLVAVIRLGKDSADCLLQFLTLGVKASIWCRKHLKMTLMSIQESQEEEHSNLFFQLLLDALKFSAASFSALARCPPSEDKVLMNTVENFTLEQLNLMIESVSEIQSIHKFGPEILKAVQMVIDATIKFSEFHCQALDWESSGEEFNKTSPSVNHVINVYKCIIETLCELGTIAAKGGGGLVTVLNVSWKGVFTVLQQGNMVVSSKVNVAAIILNLVSLVIEPMKYAAATWSSVMKEPVSATDARRIFLPVKFFLINAVKISCLCPCQAYLVRKEIIFCILVISTYKVWVSNEKLLETVTEAITELLEQPCLDLVKCILNSTDLKQDLKHDIMDLLFTTERCSFPDGYRSACFMNDPTNGIFNTNCEGRNDAKILLLGRINFLLNLMKHSFDLSDDAKLLITTKLNWLLDILVQEDVYASVLLLQVPFSYISGKTTELKWLPLLSCLLHALKTFMVAVSKNYAWLELQFFLLDNLLHPHFLCWDIVMELWCFMLRYADDSLVNDVISKLFSVMKLLASSEPVLVYSSALRKMARSMTMLLTYGAHTKRNEIFESIFIQDKSQLSTVIWVALILEGFSLNLLSEKMKNIVIQSTIRDYLTFIGNFNETSMLASSSATIGLPVFSASTIIQSMKLSTSDIDVRTLKFLLALLRSYKISGVEQAKGVCRKLISETLGIISCVEHLYAANEMEEVILELEKLFISGPTASDALLYECKSSLAPFLAGLAHIKMTETDDNAKSCAVWELYHMLFKERHWAFIHLGLTAFGYFAARTSCDELWRFVPQNAALSYDLESGKQVSEDGFMLEFKIFLEKEMALLTVTPCSEQLALLMKEGLVLKDMLNSSLKLCGTGNKCKSMEIDEGPSSRKRKLPEGLSKGMELLKNGLKVMRQGLSLLEENHVDSRELHDKLRSHFSGLEDELYRLGSQGGVD
ncbi:uncharacterized protein LOC103483511 isoform X1 [Cucumis melo]|uniref:Uncharacterized protein LOC103483511 isoform X1 n=3 Tax=Cucumis melo TaxID=3656 RepID=A0ABM3KW16_CUCME|nr:uncharacterized protein LOC103483511 isoform X1 [Cucumis melo]XP_050941974.1 uncharacterized protein LOC103483511 isoform X1 [Cucumis melo]